MRFLFRSRWGESMPLARRVIAEGHEAKLSISDRTATVVGDGLVPKAYWTPEEIERADVIVFDCSDRTLPAEAEALRHRKRVLGTSRIAEQLETDRGFATELARKAGLHIPLYEDFSGPRAFEDAEKWLNQNEKKLDAGVVLKANKANVGTQVAENVEQMMRLFPYFSSRFERDHHTPDFVLQQVIEGIEVSTEAWFTGTQFCVPNSTLEEPKLMNGGIGEKIGSAGETVWCYEQLEVPLVEQLLLPLTPFLKHTYRGPLDVNAIVDTMGRPWFLEFTPRFGWGAITCLCELVPDFAGLLAAIAAGDPFTGTVRTGEFATGIGVHIPPYPIRPLDTRMAEDLPITGFDPNQYDGIYPMEVKLDSNGDPVTSGPTGWIAQCCGHGESIQESADDAYGVVDLVHVPKLRYRTDIGVSAQRRYKALRKHHLLEEDQ